MEFEEILWFFKFSEFIYFQSADNSRLFTVNINKFPQKRGFLKLLSYI